VTVVHVSDELSERSEPEGRRILDDALTSARGLAPDVAVAARLLHGSVFRELAAVADAGDLLVLGTRKTGFLRGRLVGSREVLVATTSPASVAVVPDLGQADRRGVVVGIDRLGGSPAALALAAEEAERLGQELIVLHAAPLQASSLADASDMAALLLRDAAAYAARAAFPPSVSTRLARRPVVDALLDAGRTVSLLVLGTSHGGNPATIAGPVVHDVLVNLNAPVVVARPAAL
jgi:nucleotide-binding universal stress UspA family protein